MSILLLAVGFAGVILGVVLLKIAAMTRSFARIAHSSIDAARGLVEICGAARAPAGAPTRDAEGVPCIWHRVLIEYGSEDDRLEHDKIEGGAPADPAAVDTILLDDGTGRCAMVIGRPRNFFEREERPAGRNTRRVILRIREGTKIYAVGRVKKLARPERGATHRIEWDSTLKAAYSNRSLQTMATDIPKMTKWATGLLALGAPALVAGLWLAFSPMWM